MQYDINFDMLDMQKKLAEVFDRVCDKNLKGSDLQEELNRAMGVTEVAKMRVHNNMSIMKAAEMSGAPIDGLNLIPTGRNVTPPGLPSKDKPRRLLSRPEPGGE